MDETIRYLALYQQLCTEQLQYLSACMQQREALDKEIEKLYQNASRCYAYVCAMLNGEEVPTTRIDKAYMESLRPSLSHKSSSRHKAKRQFHQPRPVLQMTQDGKLIHRYQSMRQAYKATGISISNISIAAQTHSCTKDGSCWQFEDTLPKDNLTFNDYIPPAFSSFDALHFDASLPVLSDLPSDWVDGDNT